MKRLYKKILYRIKLFVYQKHVYGFHYAFWSLCHSFDRRCFLLFHTIITRNRDEAIINYLSTTYANLIKEFAAKAPVMDGAVISPASPIWICWWQGPDNMPEIVKACYKSVQKYADGHPVKLITKDNFNNFVSVPEYILDKFNSGLITVTHFSDILRVALLYEYGGFWLDATMFLTKEISISNRTYSFFTLKGTYKVDNISKARWTGFCIAGVKYGILFEYMRDFFYLYWKTHNELVDYVLIDYVIETAYQLIPYIKSVFDKLPYNNTDIYSLQYHLHEEFSEYLFTDYCTQTQFHKLTWKKKFDMYTKENKLTFYGYLIEMSLGGNELKV